MDLNGKHPGMKGLTPQIDVDHIIRIEDAGEIIQIWRDRTGLTSFTIYTFIIDYRYISPLSARSVVVSVHLL